MQAVKYVWRDCGTGRLWFIVQKWYSSVRSELYGSMSGLEKQVTEFE